MRSILLFFAAALLSAPLFSQNYDQLLSVPLRAEVSTSPAAITLHWKGDPTATGYVIHRKNKTAAAFFAQVASLPATDSTWTDMGIVGDKSYEYRIQEVTTGGVGYVNSGIELAPVHNRGRVILVVDSTITDGLGTEISRLIADLQEDGWLVARINVPRTMPVTEVKQLIINARQQDPLVTKALFLLGHVPVPYSGNLNPDGHPDHLGAWPCDAYYADVDGIWTDETVNSTVASDPRNQNVPGDGKFDQTSLPSSLEMQVGRVDFYNLGSFPLTEVQLLSRYLEKDHNWRHRLFTVPARGAIENNFGGYSEGFAQSGWKNFAPLVGPDSTRYLDWDGLKTQEYLWAYGCGGGWYQGASGITTTPDLVNDTLHTVFAMTFGSYFGDWDTPDNLLRAVLASPGTVLTNAWAGRPNWQFHHMGMGETVGYSALVSQNITGTYVPGFGGGMVHIALMGDPTLRMSIVAPPAGIVSATSYDSNIAFDFGDSPDTSVAGYFVYRRFHSDSVWILRTFEPLTVSEYVDSCLSAGVPYDYMAKALKLEITPSGSYWNLSQGVIAENLFAPSSPPVLGASFTTNIVPGSIEANFDATLLNANSWVWDFGDSTTSVEEDPSHLFTNGTYIVTLTAFGPCSQSISVSDTLEFVGASQELHASAGWRVAPNPATDILWLENRSEESQSALIRLFSADGQLVFSGTTGFLAPESRFSLPVNNWPDGLYLFEIQTEKGLFTQKVLLKK